MSVFETVMLCIALAGLIIGLLMLAGGAAAAIEKDREHDEHEKGLPL